MLTMFGSPRKCCDGLTRRETLQAGSLSLLGGLLGGGRAGMASPVQRPAGNGKAKSVIVLYLLGGAPTQDMCDLKPLAPDGIRSEFDPIATNVPGMELSDLLPKSARWMHKTAIVRSVNHKAGCHNPMPSLTGYPEPLPSIGVVQDHLPPSIGSVCDYLSHQARPNGEETHTSNAGQLPAYVHMPCMLGWGQHIRRAGPYAGFLGRQYDPLFTECEPTSDRPSAGVYDPQVVKGVPRLPTAKLPAGISLDRLNLRRSLTRQFDDQLRQTEAREEFVRSQDGAMTLLTSPAIRAAFDVESVSPELQEQYGKTLFGSSALVARKLVQEGVKFVNVTWDIFWTRPGKLDGAGWDTHQKNAPILRNPLLPNFDQTFSGLMQDLSDTGLLDETLVVVMSDMGRTPKVNKNGGRDHWTFCYSVMLAGAGIQGGTIYGASDGQAAYVKDNPVSPADINATIYRCLGIDPEVTVPDSSGQPVRISMGGRSIDEILV